MYNATSPRPTPSTTGSKAPKILYKTTPAKNEPADNPQQLSNIDVIKGSLPSISIAEGASALVCSKPGDPTNGGWPAQAANGAYLSPANNNYFCLSSFRPGEDGKYKARKEQAVACYGLMLDDIGTKVPIELIDSFQFSALIETSPGNHQGLILFKEPITDFALLDRLLKALIAMGLCDPGATGPVTRWARLPVGINGKEEYRDERGNPFQCRLAQWHPERRYTPGEIIDQLGLDLETEERDKPNPATDIIQIIISCLRYLEPDCGYQDWLLALMAIFHATKGSKEGLRLAIEWSSKGSKFQGEEEIEKKWRSFDLNKEKPVTIGTLIKMAQVAGADVNLIPKAEQFERCETKIVNPESNANQEASMNKENIREEKTVKSPLETLQEQYALIYMGQISVVDIKALKDISDKDSPKSMPLLKKADATLMLQRKLLEIYPLINSKDIIQKFWTDTNTVMYDGVEFNPINTGSKLLNLWIEPTIIPTKGDWFLIKDFLLNVICDNEQEVFEYLIRYIAHALQKPQEKPGVMIILMGGQGTGKGTLGRILREIWGYTYLQVSSIDSILGNFNGPLERSIIVFMDEAMFAGDRRSSDRLKSLVTEESVLINEKYQPSRQIRSYHRLFAATNADHFKHTERDDRRDLTLRVSEQHKGDSDYWRSLNESMENGGIAAMVHDLLQMDLSTFNVRNRPNTKEFIEQKLRSLDPVASWWFNCLTEGCLKEDEGDWPEFIKTSGIIDYIMSFTGRKIYSKPTAVSVAAELKRLCPSVKNKQKQERYSRSRGFELPPLKQARREFERYIGGEVSWPEED